MNPTPVKWEGDMYCARPVENGKAICGVKLDCHLHDWRQKDFLSTLVKEMEGKRKDTDDEMSYSMKSNIIGFNAGISAAVEVVKEMV